MPRVEGELPSESSWRYRRQGVPRAFALFGVAVGFLALIVPGVFALRSYRRWREGVSEPTFAWTMAALGLVAIPLVALFSVLPIVAVGAAFLVGLPLVLLLGPRH